MLFSASIIVFSFAFTTVCVSAINELNNFDPKISLSLSSTFSYFVLISFSVCLLPKEICYMCISICTRYIKFWTIKKTEHCRIEAFELWCWRRLLRVPWTARRYNQSILKEISPEYSLEGLMLKLKLQYFGHLMQRTDSLEKTLMLGKIESRRRRG